jgi:hypothetical protein
MSDNIDDKDSKPLMERVFVEEPVKQDKYWKRKNFQVGRKKKFKTPRDLWNAACDYFDWAIDNPIVTQKTFHASGLITKANEFHERPFKITEMCNFIGLDYSNYTRYRKEEAYKSTCDTIDTIIYNQKFDGAAVGKFNQNIIARDLGLVDKKDLSSTDGSMTPKESTTTVVTGADVEAILSKI